jgi:hypothetical protein
MQAVNCESELSLSRKEEQEVEMLVGIMAVEIGTTVVEALAAGEEEAAEAGAVADCERPDECQFRWRMDGVTGKSERAGRPTTRSDGCSAFQS